MSDPMSDRRTFWLNLLDLMLGLPIALLGLLAWGAMAGVALGLAWRIARIIAGVTP